nr:hypothetical protein Iba_chr04aCG18990 [Ipomoea batatas]
MISRSCASTMVVTENTAINIIPADCVNQLVLENIADDIPKPPPKTRFQWPPEHHSIFMGIVTNLGGIYRLTRANVSSHLQKVRLLDTQLKKRGRPKRWNKTAKSHQKWYNRCCLSFAENEGWNYPSSENHVLIAAAGNEDNSSLLYSPLRLAHGGEEQLLMSSQFFDDIFYHETNADQMQFASEPFGDNITGEDSLYSSVGSCMARSGQDNEWVNYGDDDDFYYQLGTNQCPPNQGQAIGEVISGQEQAGTFQQNFNKQEFYIPTQQIDNGYTMDYHHLAGGDFPPENDYLMAMGDTNSSFAFVGPKFTL